MVEYNVVGFRVKFRAVLIHLRDPVHLIGVVDGTSHQTQSGHAAACGLDLGENQKGDNDCHQGVGKVQAAAQV